jgi:hypothetical protein
MRYIIEGEWTGYNPSQRRVVHREVTTRKDYADAVKKLGSILYSDGTSLILSVREAIFREKIVENLQYRELIRECIARGVRAVAQLP